MLPNGNDRPAVAGRRSVRQALACSGHLTPSRQVGSAFSSATAPHSALRSLCLLGSSGDIKIQASSLQTNQPTPLNGQRQQASVQRFCKRSSSRLGVWSEARGQELQGIPYAHRSDLCRKTCRGPATKRTRQPQSSVNGIPSIRGHPQPRNRDTE